MLAISQCLYLQCSHNERPRACAWRKHTHKIMAVETMKPTGAVRNHVLQSRNEFVHSQQCTKPTWLLLLQYSKSPLTSYTGLQQHKGSNYFLSTYFGLDTAWIYWKDGSQPPGNISVCARGGKREEQVTGSSTEQPWAGCPWTLHCLAAGAQALCRVWGHPAAQPNRTWRCGSSILTHFSRPALIHNLCGKATNKPWYPRQQITSAATPLLWGELSEPDRPISNLWCSITSVEFGGKNLRHLWDL